MKSCQNNHIQRQIAIESAKKEAVTDARKRAIRLLSKRRKAGNFNEGNR